MDLLFSFNDRLTKEIVTNRKFLFFGNNFSENMKNCDKIYICNNNKIIGESRIKAINIIPRVKVGTYNFILYYVRDVLKDKDLTEEVERVLNFDLPGYCPSYKLSFIFNFFRLENFDEYGGPMDLLKLNRAEWLQWSKNYDKANKLCEECDDWLTDIGYYQDGESFYRKYIEISDLVLYNVPIDINNFKNKKNEKIIKAPRSWCYVEREV